MRLESATQEPNGAVTLRYAVRCRKRTPRDQFLEEIRALAASQGFTVEARSAPGPEPVALKKVLRLLGEGRSLDPDDDEVVAVTVALARSLTQLERPAVSQGA